MNEIDSSQSARRLARAVWFPILLVFLGFGSGRLSAQDQSKTTAQPAPSPAAETATLFLRHLEKADAGAAIGLWDGKVVNEKLKTRINVMASKIKKLGGIKKIDIGPCEERRARKFEQVTGEKIDVVPMEIICGDESLILAVFSFRKKDGASRIFQLESLKEWGGTASLDEELAYSH